MIVAVSGSIDSEGSVLAADSDGAVGGSVDTATATVD